MYLLVHDILLYKEETESNLALAHSEPHVVPLCSCSVH